MAGKVARLTRNVTGRAILATTVVLFAGVAGAGRAGAQAMPSASKMMDWGTSSFLLLEQSDFLPGEEGRPVNYEVLAWYGGAYNRLWVRAEGEQRTASRTGIGNAEILFGRLVSPFWDALIGVRVDGRWGDVSASRAALSLGMQGLAPLRFEFSPTLFVSRNGIVSGRLDASYQLLLTQRLIAEPSLDVNVSSRAVPALAIGPGVNEIALGTRLRYEIRRQFGPYVGVSWTRRTRGSSARAESRSASEGAIVFGVRAWR